ncbi:MAG: ATP-binding protein, partial [Bacilli bacterium]|nr:ATP-binding protein [Bacilli bacterium]
KILGFENSNIFVENNKGVADTNYIGYHVVFPEPDHKIVGEIIGISEKQVTIMLIGEIINGKFSNGVLKKPSMNSIARIIFKSELESILGNQNYLDHANLLFGTSPIYKDYVITSSLNNFFANHFAIIGNTGSGKSCGLARLIQNVFFTSSNELPKNAHVSLFDVYGEYYNTFDEMNKFEGLHFKKYTTQQEFGSAELLTIPAYFLGVDDLAILLGATEPTQLPVLSKAIDLVKIFKSHDPKAEEHKNDIIAKCVLDILSSGKSSTQLRDQVVSVLSSYNTETLNLNSLIRQPGYDRTLRQCLNIDDQGKINSMNLVIDFLQKHIRIDIDKV